MPFDKINEGYNAVELLFKNLEKISGYDIKISEWAYMNLINSLNREKKSYDALKIGKVYISDYLYSSWSLFYLGRIYERLTNFESAKKYYQKAIELEK